MSPLDYLARRLFREPFDVSPRINDLAWLKHQPIYTARFPALGVLQDPPPKPFRTASDEAAFNIIAGRWFPMSSLPVPATTGQRVTAAELKREAAYPYPLEAMTADPTPNPALVNECVVCNPNGEKRPDTKAGREGR